MESEKKILELRTHQLLKIVFEFMGLSDINLMIYGGAQSGIWGRLALKELPSLRIIGIEANPNVFINYYPKLRYVFDSYICAAISRKPGLVSLLIPRDNLYSAKKGFDEKLFWRYHRDMKLSRESFQTNASLHIDMVGEEFEQVFVPTVRIEDLLYSTEKCILFLDIQGEDFNLLSELDLSVNNSINLIYVEWDRVYQETSRTLSFKRFMDSIAELGFVYFANDSMEGNSQYNMLLVREEEVKLMDLIQLPETSFTFDLKDITEISIVAKMRKARLPFYTFVARLISVIGIDVHKNR
jgi:hypothetical protein